MPTVGTNKFLGFSSKPDKIMPNVGIGSDCHNVIINEGDLCNHPYTVEEISWGDDLERLISIFKLKSFTENFKFIFRSDGFLIYLDKNNNVNSFEVLMGFYGEYLTTEINQFHRAVNGNFFSFGNVIYLLGSFLRYPNFYKNHRLYRMLRIYETGVVDLRPNFGLVGCAQPAKVEHFSYAASSPLDAGEYSFACTFVFNSDFDTLTYNSSTSYLSGNDLESNATIWDSGNVTFNGSNTEVLKVYLPKIYANLPRTINIHETFSNLYAGERIIAVGVYAKLDVEEEYKFVGFFKPTANIATDNDREYYIKVNIDSRTAGQAFSTTKFARITGHSVRQVCTQMASYRGRIYSNKFDYPYRLSNELQVSPLYHEEFLLANQHRLDLNLSQSQAENIPNYVDENQNKYIGDSKALTGLIEYLQQLVLFKEDSMWVLTDDILIGEVIKIFNVGCCNILGGHGYDILDSILYFVDWTGVYAYSGQTDPIDISEPIKELLAKIDKDRYSYCRLKADNKYNLLYLTFPHGAGMHTEEIPTYIYHPKEGGAWTKIDPASSLILYQEERWLNRRNSLEKLGLLNDEALGLIRLFWQSGLLTVPDQVLKKHWKQLRLQTQYNKSKIGLQVVDKDDHVLKGIDTFQKDMHIGMTMEEIFVAIKLHLSFPFRINGFNIDVHLRGRR